MNIPVRFLRLPSKILANVNHVITDIPEAAPCNEALMFKVPEPTDRTK